MNYYGRMSTANTLTHHGIQGQKWGVRRYQNPDGTLTAKGKARASEKKNDTSKSDIKKRSFLHPTDTFSDTEYARYHALNAAKFDGLDEKMKRRYVSGANGGIDVETVNGHANATNFYNSASKEQKKVYRDAYNKIMSDKSFKDYLINKEKKGNEFIRNHLIGMATTPIGIGFAIGAGNMGHYIYDAYKTEQALLEKYVYD